MINIFIFEFFDSHSNMQVNSVKTLLVIIKLFKGAKFLPQILIF